MKTPETLRVLEKYAPKKLHGAIKEITKDEYGYEVVLEPLWLFERNNTSFYSDTIKELKKDLKEVEHFELENWKEIMKGMGYSLIEINQILGETKEESKMQKELKFYVPNGKFYRVIEVEGEYRLKNNNDIRVMICSNRNTRFVSNENAESIKDRLLGANNRSLYHLVFFDKVKHKELSMNKRLRSIEIVE